MSKFFSVTAVLLTALCVSNALYISWNTKNTLVNLTESDIFIHLNNLYVPEFKRMNPKFKNLTKMSMDERCAHGMPLSIAALPNQPYSGIMGPMRIARKFGFRSFGIIPGVINRIVKYCCPRSEIIYGKVLKSVRQAEDHLSKNLYDFTFPIYVQRKNIKTYKNQPFVHVLQAPRVMLVVYDDPVKITKTSALANTIFSAWPFLFFILGVAIIAGIVVWLLEYVGRSKEFSKLFIQGAWDGFWWAVVTMTTVGYGDKAPKTLPGRMFCFLWIIVGINIIAIFTALVTASVSASTRPYFNILGAKIGAVNGSEEYRFGVSMNLDMIAFPSPVKITSALEVDKEIDGMLIDNYSLTRFSQLSKKIRLEMTFNHAINYGMVIPSGSPRTEQCVRSFMKNYHHEIFDDLIAKQLKPLPPQEGESSYGMKAAGQLFYQEKLFNKVIMVGGGVVGALVLIGLVWDYGYRRHKQGCFYGTRYNVYRKTTFPYE
ncbi:predicted protein [Nematostella vectensis]|uniref:Potassium channel domain-containing protein n=1 Tax=Nematostella vectensis TaxID=45351 RepID=A7SKI2_NEMVE|nr:predicted protein [Nematostella vectensis]|eukprot:XP_001627824.1 predicted protein [Nematostella vectensis]